MGGQDFEMVPMILNDRDQWDHAALSAVIPYRGASKQVWDNMEIASPWLNLMRYALNAGAVLTPCRVGQ